MRRLLLSIPITLVLVLAGSATAQIGLTITFGVRASNTLPVVVEVTSNSAIGASYSADIYLTYDPTDVTVTGVGTAWDASPNTQVETNILTGVGVLDTLVITVASDVAVTIGAGAVVVDVQFDFVPGGAPSLATHSILVLPPSISALAY